MKKLCLALLIFTLPLSAQERATQSKRPGDIAGYATRDATVLSMMGWGVGLAVGIGALCALVKNTSASGSSSHTSSSSH